MRICIPGSQRLFIQSNPSTFDTDGNGFKGPGIVIEEDYEAGTVELMGNNGYDNGTYYVFICPRGKLV